MYEGFFELNGRPFLASPAVHRYFPAAVIENARLSLARAIERGEGAGLVIGPAGTGKTLLCQLLIDQFADRFATALLSSGRLATRMALLQAILYELHLPYRGMDEGELRLALLDQLQPSSDGKAGLLLVIDEAHSLPWKLLEEVRLLTNFARDGQPRVRVVLAGNPLLEERFASPKMAAFSQRLAARCYLEALTAGETAAYVRGQVVAVGGDPNKIFHAEALATVYCATDGIPRLINQVCDHALLLASLGGVKHLDSEAIEEAWADLQQLPGPWTTAKAAAPQTQVVEFGGLDEDAIDEAALEPSSSDEAFDELPDAIPFRPKATPLQLAQPEESLELISNQLSSLERDFQPAGTIGTEVDLDFPEFGDPFGEKFAEEEVVLDPYHGVEIFAEVPRVNSWEGEELASLLEPLDVSSPKKPAMLHSARRRETSPTVRPIRRLPDEHHTPIGVVEEDSQPWRPAAAPARLEFRQLFSKLRRSTGHGP